MELIIGEGGKRNTLDYSRACFFPPLVEKRRTRIDGAVVQWPGRKVDNRVALIPMDEIDRPVSPARIYGSIVFRPILFRWISLVEFHDVVALIILSGSDRSE